MTLAGKVAVLPCTGVGQVVGTIARQAAYRVCEDMRPEDTVLLCLPALVRGVQEDIDMVRQCPVVVVEGCQERCAAHALSTRGGSPSATVFVPDVMKGKGVKISREARRQLSAPELAAVELVAKAVVTEVDHLCTRMKTGEHK
ncbi:MAG TPA: hypothetical protein ENN87_02495 [Phycisphaerales bacterium]|nr:hypothetical protein [Phycisphaerales bacterium]